MGNLYFSGIYVILFFIKIRGKERYRIYRIIIMLLIILCVYRMTIFMSKKLIGIILAVTAMGLSMALLFSSCSPVMLTKIKSASFENISPEFSGDKFHKAARSSYEAICKSGLIELYFDKTTSSVGILDTSSDVFWSTLPSDKEDKSLSFSALEAVLLTESGKQYALNTQDGSVCFGNFSFEKTTNGVNVKYSLSIDAETGKADINSLPEESIRADITVSYTLSDGSFYASVNMNNLQLPKGVYIERIKLLNSFGAYSSKNADDFIFVPDGNGAIIKTGIEDPDFTPVSLKVYGDDPAVINSGKASAPLGAFGIKHGKGAFLSIIESGDAAADINAFRLSDTSLNSVGAEFAVTDVSAEAKKTKQVKALGNEYNGEIRLCYRFLSGKSATYSGMATACRENLIRNSVISSKSLSAIDSSLPLVVNLQFGFSDSKGKLTVKSTFEQAQTLMNLLKAKGINSVYLHASGLFTDANNGESGDFGDFIKQLGSKEDYDSLYSYMKTQNFPIYIDTPILSVKKASGNKAKNLYGSKMTYSAAASTLNLSSAKRGYLKMSELEDVIEEILNNSSDISFDGFALSDIGTVLYSDYSADFYPRESSKKEISALIPVLSSNKPVMISKGNFYSLKNVSVISDIPQSTVSRKENDAYRAIPFASLILHGTYDYSLNSINLSENPEETFLRSVEFGAVPSADWYCVNTDANDKYGYNNNINEIVSYCVKASDILSDLRGARMTSHYEVQSGVFCAEYNNSAKVYVNYTEKSVKINGITVNARDCVKIS